MELDYKQFTSNGDLNDLGVSLEQDVNLVLLSQKGEWKQFPNIGAGVENYQNSRSESFEIQGDVQLELSRAFPEKKFRVEVTDDKEVIVTEKI